MILPGRDALLQRLQRCLAEPGREQALVVLRLRKLAAITEMAGNEAASALLDTAQARLREATPGEFIAALGEGTYAAVCDVSGCGAEAAAERLVAAISRPLVHEGRSLYAPANAGACALEPARGDAATHYERGLRALQQAMSRGPGRVEAVSEALVDVAVADWEMRTLLDEAGLRGEFTLEYQPVVSLHDGGIPKIEALLRWETGAFGRVGPARFVPMLEDSGLIRSVGEWVLREACLQARAWNAPGAPVARMAVNVSPVQLASPDFEAVAARVLEETGCPAAHVELEITEGMLVRDFARVRARLESLAALGFTVAVDDFGAGYSSLGQLAQLPVHHLKMDRTLIEGLPDSPRCARIVKAVIALAEALGVGVTAEGVERPEQAAWLRRFPGLLAQGYLFARPAPAAEAAPMLHSRRAAGVRRLGEG